MKRPRYIAWTRLWTGKMVTAAYVHDRLTGKVVKACPHQHRKHTSAVRCSEKLLRSFLRNTAQEEVGR